MRRAQTRLIRTRRGETDPCASFWPMSKIQFFNTKIEFSRPAQFLNNNTANLTKFAGAHEGPVPHLLEKLMENANLTKFAGAHEGPVPHLLEKLLKNANLTKFAEAHEGPVPHLWEQFLDRFLAIFGTNFWTNCWPIFGPNFGRFL